MRRTEPLGYADHFSDAVSKMREAFEKLHCGNNPHTTLKNTTTGDYVLPSVQDAWSGFQTGHQAAIAAVKERDRVIIWRCKLWGGEAVRCIPLLEELPED